MKKHTAKIRRFTMTLLLVASALIASGTAADAECEVEFFRKAHFEDYLEGGGQGPKLVGGHFTVSLSTSGVLHDVNLKHHDDDHFGGKIDPNGNKYGDMISSIRFVGTTCGDTYVELYEDTDFGGEMFKVTQDVSNLKDHDFNDEASSIKVYFDVPTTPNWSFYRGVTQGGNDRDIAAASDGSLRIISGEGYIYSYSSTGDWQEMHNVAQASRVAVDPQGRTWIAQENGTIYRFDSVSGSGWEQIHNQLAKDIAVGADGTVMIVNVHGYVFKLVAGGWQAIHNIGNLSRIAVAPNGMAWVVDIEGTIHKQTGPSSWELVHRTAASDISVSVDGLVWLTAITGGVTKLADPGSSELTDMGTVGGEAMNISAYHHAFAVGNAGTHKEATYASAPSLMTANPLADRTITAAHSGKVLDVAVASGADGGTVQQWDSHGGTNQKWELVPDGVHYQIKTGHSSKCLDVAVAAMNNGGTVQQWDCHGGTNQKWNLVPDGAYYQIKAVHSGKCLDVAVASMANGGTVQQWDCHGGDNQKWKISPEFTVLPPAQ